MFIEDKIIYKMVEFWYNMNEQRNGGVAFLSTKPTQKAALTVAFLRGRGRDSIPVRFSAKGAQVCVLRKPDERESCTGPSGGRNLMHPS